MPGITILEHELSELRLLVERQAGILLDCPNSALAAHVAEYLEHQELESFSALLERLRASDQDPSRLPGFLDGILNVNSGFFRHPGAMNALARLVIPQRISSRKPDEAPGTLRVWSAGCGTGEEAYSIAMAVCDAFGNGTGSGSTNGNGGKDAKETKETKEKSGMSRHGGVVESGAPVSAIAAAKDWSIHIVGSDLLASAVEVAERGLYPQSALTGLPPATIRAFFSKIGNASGGTNGTAEGPQSQAANGSNSNGVHLLVKPRLRSLVTFNTMNLTKPVYIGRFDCIFCMDVLPHLSRAQRSALIERLHLYLEPGGYLFLSQTEKLYAPNLNFRPETYDGYTLHRKPLAAAAAYGR